MIRRRTFGAESGLCMGEEVVAFSEVHKRVGDDPCPKLVQRVF